MRIAAIGATLLFALASCSTTEPSQQSPFQQPNQLMAGEITRRIEQIPYQHRDELLQNLMWLAQTGEQTIPAVLEGLRHDSPKVRSSCAWVLGRLVDRRTIPNLQAAMRDPEASVRLECARSLVLMGDLQWSPNLIEGLDSDRKEVRYLCHEALKTATGHDFGYDHLNQNERELQVAVLRWRQWWSDYSGDGFFAQSYQQSHNLGAELAAPAGETRTTQPAANGAPGSGMEPATSGSTAGSDGSSSGQGQAQPQNNPPQNNQPQNNQPQSNQAQSNPPQNNPMPNAPSQGAQSQGSQPQGTPAQGTQPQNNGEQGAANRGAATPTGQGTGNAPKPAAPDAANGGGATPPEQGGGAAQGATTAGTPRVGNTNGGTANSQSAPPAAETTKPTAMPLPLPRAEDAPIVAPVEVPAAPATTQEAAPQSQPVTPPKPAAKPKTAPAKPKTNGR